MEMLHAIVAVCGPADAAVANEELSGLSRSIQTDRRVGHAMRQLSIDVGVQAKSDDLADALHRGRSWRTRYIPFHFFARKRAGVYIVHLNQDGFVDHAVCVDCERRLIWDSDEEYSIALTADTLELYGAIRADELLIEDARKVVAKKT